MSRKERKAEEARILKELDEAVAAEKAAKGVPLTEETTAPRQKIHCKRCKAEMQEGVCPVCGYKIYTPMTEEKRKKVRLIVGGVCIIVFLVVFLLLK